MLTRQHTGSVLRPPAGDAAELLSGLKRMLEHHDQQRQHPTLHEISAQELDAAYATCIAITKQHSKSFYLSTALLPPEKRRAIRALYAFCRTSDDIVDQAAAGSAPHALAHWVHLVHQRITPRDNAVLIAWNDTVNRYQISQELVDELLAGIAMDLTVTRYESFDDLWLYCYRVASVVGLISMQIIGHSEDAVDYAVKLGVALQLTNILRDIGEDAQRGRVYIPQQDLVRFGITDADIINRHVNHRFKAMIRFQSARAHALYEEAWPGIGMLTSDSRLAIAAAATIYRGILDAIHQNGYDVFTRRAYVPLWQKLTLLYQARQRLKRDFQ
jgi:phytoene synthase